jgi:hypothetical protein
MIAYRTNPRARMGVVPELGVVTPITPPEIGIDVEHCLWAAAHGCDPLDVIHALGMAWPAERYPEWADALLAVRVAASRMAAASRHPITHRRAA